ncbi:MAG: ATP-dependent Clp protease ATP-binding subunit [Paludibacteraceae bacterium]|nr:ATP-dependent Clp protease ATP-binding subunit [Paludibacteraceae bacterium]
MIDFSQHFHKLLQYAGEEAYRAQNAALMPEHLLLGVCRMPACKAYEALCACQVDIDKLKERLLGYINSQMLTPNPQQMPPMSEVVNTILRIATSEQTLYQSPMCGTLHVLLAIVHERANYAATVLRTEYQVTYDVLEDKYPHPATVNSNKKQPQISPDENEERELAKEAERMANSLFSHIAGAGIFLLNSRATKSNDMPVPEEPNDPTDLPPEDESDTPALDHFGRDLTQMAKDGALDPVIGRKHEIERLEQILMRRKKNNPILIGEAGVGKTAIVEGLAQKWITARSKKLRNRRIIALDVASIVAGTTYRGQFEERMKDIIYELDEHHEIILFIDEIHTIMGAGNASGSLDAANILKPALARGEVQCIGATTIAEYRHSIEKDAALDRRFQRIMVAPATEKETLAILHGLRERYSLFHGKEYTDDALEACVHLTERYLSDRALPDKAIDALDEAGARTAAKTITGEDIANVVSIMSGVPVERMAKKESDQLLELPTVLRNRVLGQDQAIDKIVRAIRRSRLGLNDPRKPLGTFFFLGSTGVGKTYLAQCLAEELFGKKDALIRFDMSEYMEKHTVSLLVGAPPGYIAHEEGGKLTEAVLRHPYSIILFDEIEKAHPDIFNILLQVLDEGRMTDRQGRTVDFRNTIIILTSNVGTRQLNDFGAGTGFEASDVTPAVAEQTMQKALRKTFPPEFVNRIDDIIHFAPLSKQSIARILDLEIVQLKQRLLEQGYRLSLSAKAKAQLLERAFDPKNGARPVKRAVQANLEDTIMDQMMVHPENKNIKIQTL